MRSIIDSKGRTIDSNRDPKTLVRGRGRLLRVIPVAPMCDMEDVVFVSSSSDINHKTHRRRSVETSSKSLFGYAPLSRSVLCWGGSALAASAPGAAQA